MVFGEDSSMEPARLSGERRKGKARVRERIIDAAAGIFEETGFSRVSVAMIAQRAGVSQVTVFNHFGDKYGLIEAAVARIADSKVEEYRRVLGSEDPWPERLRSVLADKERVLRGFKGEFVSALYREYPELARRAAEIQPRILNEVTYPFLEEGRRLGYVPLDVSMEAIACYLTVMAAGFSSSPGIMDRVASDPAFFAELYDLILHGLVRGGPVDARR